MGNQTPETKVTPEDKKDAGKKPMDGKDGCCGGGCG